MLSINVEALELNAARNRPCGYIFLDFEDSEDVVRLRKSLQLLDNLPWPPLQDRKMQVKFCPHSRKEGSPSSLLCVGADVRSRCQSGAASQWKVQQWQLHGQPHRLEAIAIAWLAARCCETASLRSRSGDFETRH
ncbi:Mcat [Symbiodinium microadriaticum]|nr:Mcat [Symbiodinium microadriaticum]